MWDILRLTRWHVQVALCLEDKGEMILSIKVLDLFVDLILPRESLAWEHMVLILYHHWKFHLDPHFNYHIMEPRLVLCLDILLA